MDHDPTPVYRATRAIAKLQALFGVIPKIYGKGRNAKVTANAASQAALAIQQNDIAHCIYSSAHNSRVLHLHSQMVADLMKSVQQELQRSQVNSSRRKLAPSIDALVLLDRTVDLVTPLSTQLTYEGLINEIYGIKHCQ